MFAFSTSAVNFVFQLTSVFVGLSTGVSPADGTCTFRARAIFFNRCNSFLATRSDLASLFFSNWSSYGSALAGTSNTQSFSCSAAALLYPYLGTHPCKNPHLVSLLPSHQPIILKYCNTLTISSQTNLVFFFLVIPLSLAYCSHFVIALPLGTGFSLGRTYSGLGNFVITTSSTLSKGKVQILLIRSCVLSLAKFFRYVFGFPDLFNNQFDYLEGYNDCMANK